jgi:hypothetical protein
MLDGALFTARLYVMCSPILHPYPDIHNIVQLSRPQASKKKNPGICLSHLNRRLQWEDPIMVCCSQWPTARWVEACLSVARSRSEGPGPIVHVRLRPSLVAGSPFPIIGSATFTHDNNTLDGLKIISTPQMQTENSYGCVLAIIRLKMAQLEAYDLSFNNSSISLIMHIISACRCCLDSISDRWHRMLTRLSSPFVYRRYLPSSC